MASRVVDVIVEIAARPGPYSYSWPAKLAAPSIGDEVVVGLQSRKVAGWIIGINTACEDCSSEPGHPGDVAWDISNSALAHGPDIAGSASVPGAFNAVDARAWDLKDVLRLRRPAIYPQIAEFALAASRWHLCSPVYFLRKTRSPKVRDAGRALTLYRSARSCGSAESAESETTLVTPTEVQPSGSGGVTVEDLAPIDLIWHSAGTSSLAAAREFVESRLGQPETDHMALRARAHPGVIICPTLRQRQRMKLMLQEDGWRVGDVDDDWLAIAVGEVDVVVGGRYGVFAPIEAPAFLVVLDPVDPSMRDQGAPGADGLQIARLFAACHSIRVTVISAAPPLEVAASARVYREPFRTEAQRWPRVDLIGSEDIDPSRGVVGTIVDRSFVREPGLRLAVIVPSTGWNGWLRCSSCQSIQRCPACSGPLVPLSLDVDQPGLSERIALVRRGLVPDVMVCQKCDLRLPLRCLVCSKRSIVLAGLSAQRVHSLLSGTFGSGVQLVAPDETLDHDARVLVGGYGLLDRIEACPVVALLNLGQFYGVTSLDGLALAFYYFNRAAAVAERVLVVGERAGDNLVEGLESRNLRRAYRRELAIRQRLALPPARALARVSGSRVRELLDAQRPDVLQGIEVIEESSTSYLLVADSVHSLHERLAMGRWSLNWRQFRVEFGPLLL